MSSEAECPDQILLGAMDSDFCVLLGLAIWLEFFLAGANENTRRFQFTSGMDDKAPSRLKNNLSNALKQVWKDPEFIELMRYTISPFGLGTHRNRKTPANFMRGKCHQDDIDIPGRWKPSKVNALIHRVKLHEARAKSALKTTEFRMSLKLLKEVGDFKALSDGFPEMERGICAHTYRKYPAPATYARNCGAGADEVEIRGRWKARGNPQDSDCL